MARWTRFLVFALIGWPAAGQPFEGQIGRLDEALLGDDWYRLTPSEMPSIPLEGVTVSVFDCEEHCPDPAVSDAAGWFTFPDLAAETARLHFEPPVCPGDDPECEPLEPREEVLPNGGRTVLGAKWPAGIEDTILRYMPLIAGTIYIKWEGQIPGRSLNACGSASTWMVIINERCRTDTLDEYDTFSHELMHVYERRLRRACWYGHQDINGYVLEESWLRAYEADRVFREENDLALQERDLEGRGDNWKARESLAEFSERYFTPEALVLQSPRYETSPSLMTYREIEAYAPNRYAYFELIVFERYLDEKQWLRDNPNGEEWPGLCEAPPLESDQEPEEDDTGHRWPFPTASKASPWSRSEYPPIDPPPLNCSIGDPH